MEGRVGGAAWCFGVCMEDGERRVARPQLKVSGSVCGSADKADDMGDWRVLAAAAVCVVLLSGCVVRGLNECGGNARAAGRDGKESGGANGRAQEKCVCACVSRVLRKEAGWDGRK